MARFLYSKKEAIGSSPDAMIFRGNKKEDKSRIRIIDYTSDVIIENELEDISEAFKYDNTNTNTWLNIDGLHDVKMMQELALGFNIDSLVISNILNAEARPKIQEFDNCIYITLKMLQYDEESGATTSEILSIIIKENMLITFQEKVGDVFSPVRDRLRNSKKRIRNSKEDYLAFALLDTVIDNYIYIISIVGEEIEALDDKLISSSGNSLDEIYRLKSEVTYLRKNIKPCREMIMNFAKLDSELIADNMDVHLKELQSNIELANESIDSYREVLSDQLNIFHTNVNYHLNDILKFLTIFSVIFIPITFIAGVYGTNFDYLPELHFKYSYFIMWGVILSSVISMIFYFKRKKWM